MSTEDVVSSRSDMDSLDRDWVVLDGGIDTHGDSNDADFEIVENTNRERSDHDERTFEAAFRKEDTNTKSLGVPTLRYRYELLPRGPWIRVLRLDPGLAPDHIRCVLRPLLLAYAEDRYATVSYTWGTEQETRPIIVNGKLMDIRKNLHAFLSYVRAPDRPLNLWGEAICIGQLSIAEKGYQVQQMRRVYEGAKETYLWLGKPSTAVMNLLRLAPENIHRLVPWSSSVTDIVLGLTEIMDNPYWKRLCIIQEVFVSRAVQVRLGSIEVPWERLVQICKAAVSAIASNRKSAFKAVDTLSSSSLIRINEQRSEAAPRSFSDLISSFGACLCTDVRDRVYGLLGLASGLSMDVDYRLTNVQLLGRVMNACSSHLAADLFRPLAVALGVYQFNQTLTSRTGLRVPVEIHQCGKLENSRGSWHWNISGLQLELSTRYRRIEHGDLLYTLSLNSRSPSDVKIHGLAYILVVQRAVDREVVEGSAIERNGPHPCYVAGTALAYDLDRISRQWQQRALNKEIQEIQERTGQVGPGNVLQGAIIHPKELNERIMTLEVDVRDLMYICHNFDI